MAGINFWLILTKEYTVRENWQLLSSLIPWHSSYFILSRVQMMHSGLKGCIECLRLLLAPYMTFWWIVKFGWKESSYLESVADKSVEKIHNQGEQSLKDSMPQQSNSDRVYAPIEYTRTLEKAYHFCWDGHVQDIKYHPMPDIPDYVCIAVKVLPSMHKKWSVWCDYCNSWINFPCYHCLLFMSSWTVRMLQSHYCYIVLFGELCLLWIARWWTKQLHWLVTNMEPTDEVTHTK